MTVARIVERSRFVRWHAVSEGLGLVLTPSGYELTDSPESFNGEALPHHVTIPRDDGKPMQDGYILTERETEHAVRAQAAELRRSLLRPSIAAACGGRPVASWIDSGEGCSVPGPIAGVTKK